MHILKKHEETHKAIANYFTSEDKTTDSGIEHRVLLGDNNAALFVDFITPIVRKHQISEQDYSTRKKLLEKLKIENLPNTIPSPFPKNLSTQKGNFAEVFLAEYLEKATDFTLPIYRLRYNPNVEQSMKGDDVLMLDLDSEPVRIIIGESKFRTTPQKKDVTDIIEGLIRANKAKVPISLMFVVNLLRAEGKIELAEKVQECVVLFASDKIEIDFVGLLMSSTKASRTVDRHTSAELRNILMISVGVDNPVEIVKNVYGNLEGDYECID
ncbi:Hachiman antiphage defense system protein HamA [Aerococcus urinaeequi]|uniref:Hachiman antiphage defense system protein HamA n=1 Tax=Aerococcus urinaeequi TaxID=51665 RepID=UPI000A59B4B7|nr:Hachiman antiphage defense system protein HamA [Aerococcus urinaeequi]